MRAQAYRTLCQLLSGPAAPALTASLTPDDWPDVIAVARREGVAPLLYHALNSSGWPATIPSHVQATLRSDYYANAARNLLIYDELARILTALPVTPSPPLPVILLKGTALATTLYPTIALRPMGDIDLLVPEDRLAEAVARLKAPGYVEPHPDMAPGLNALAGHHVHLQGGQDTHLAVELHWTLIGGPHDWRSPSLPWFWTHTEEWKMENGEWKRDNPPSAIRNPQSAQSAIRHPQSAQSAIRHPQSAILTPTAHLLYLCAHLMLQHGEAGSLLRWFYDIHLMIQREGGRIEWEELVARAEEFHWAPAVHAALVGTQDRFGTRLPPGVLDALAEASYGRAEWIVARGADPLQTTASALSLRARLRLLLTIAVPSPAYMRWRYNPRPAWLWPLYYFYRWFDIVREGLSTLWRIVNSG